MFPEFGGDSSAQTDNFMTKRASGLATYRNTDFFGAVDGLDMTLQYQGKNENRDAKKQNGDGFGTSLTMTSAAAISPSAALTPTLTAPTRRTCWRVVRGRKQKPGLPV
jgi:predicted porin